MSVKVSCIIPVYNVENFISECISSVLNQSLGDIEIIIVDDGSTDSSGEICSEYANKYSNIKYFRKENEGVSIARNTGLSYATGEFVHFLDSDDTIDSDFYETCYTIAQKENSNVVLSSRHFDENCLKDLYSYTAWALFIRKSVLDNNTLVRFPAKIQPAEDGLFVHKLTAVLDGEGYSINKTSNYNYRVHAASDHIKVKKNTDKLFEQIPKWLEELRYFYGVTQLHKTRAFYLARFLNREPLGRILVKGYTKEQTEILVNRLIEIFEELVLPNIQKSKGGVYKDIPLRLRFFIATKNIYLTRVFNKMIILCFNIIPFKKLRRNLRWKYL